MNKKDLARLAMIGISAGLIVGGCQKRDEGHPRDNQGGGPQGANKMAAVQQMSPDMQAFYSTLNSDGQKKFSQLDAKHRMMAIEMMNQKGKGDNKCAGMGGCKTAEHECAGLNDCKGKGGPAIKDPNEAVHHQFINQMEQRKKANGGMEEPKRAPSTAPVQKAPVTPPPGGSSSNPYGGAHH